MTAVHELLKGGQKYDITVFQMGWRLGGKGASGRNMKPEFGHRIEEHGLHMWSGLYENAFRVMREVYEDLGRPKGAPLAECFQAFTKHGSIVLFEEWQGQWLPWTIEVPFTQSLPGEPQGKLFPPLWDYSEILIGLLMGKNSKVPPLRWVLQTALWLFLVIALFAAKVIIYLSMKLKIFEYVQILILAASDFAIHGLWNYAKRRLGRTRIRRMWIMCNFAYGHLHGLIKCDAWTLGLDQLDDYDYREWLSQYIINDEIDGPSGKKSLTLSSPLMRFLYDAQFSYIDGDLNRPDIAAGSSIKTLLRMALTCKGSILWRMQAAMGDVVFAPMYEVMQRKGVQFKFFHRLVDLKLSDDKKSVASLRFKKQATFTSGVYQPLIDVKGLPCWPAEPLWDQLVDGEVLRKKGVNFESYCDETGVDLELKVGEDFDEVIWGIPLGSLPYLACDLVKADVRYQRLLKYLKTVRTQAIQVWINKPSGFLKAPEGGRGGDGTEPLMVTYHPTPFNTVADMSFLTEHEAWNGSGHEYPLSQYYLCGPMADPTPPIQTPCGPKNSCEELDQKAAEEMVLKEGIHFFSKLSSPLFPGATIPPGGEGAPFDDQLFVQQKSIKDQLPWSRLRSQYFRANITPTERFTLTNKGSTMFRIAPGDSGVTNLKLAGDWTQNTFNYANVEATTMSGMLCAQAMSGYPKNREIIGLGFCSKKA